MAGYQPRRPLSLADMNDVRPGVVRDLRSKHPLDAMRKAQREARLQAPDVVREAQPVPTWVVVVVVVALVGCIAGLVLRMWLGGGP